MSKTKEALMEKANKDWNIIEEKMCESSTIEEAIYKVNQILEEGKIDLPLECDNADELADVVRDEWSDCWSGYSYGGC
tara:strand:- start:49 stop:282 length:234 start_codon:yes stop_codon:yes gene_type:complete